MVERTSPTPWAYEQACKTLERVKAERDQMAQELEELREQYVYPEMRLEQEHESR